MKVNRLRERDNIHRVVVLSIVLCLAVMLLVGCESGEQLPKEGEMILPLSSTVFQEGDRIPIKYTCQGQNVSPPLTWGEPPKGTQSFVLIMDDPDAPGGVFTHWILFNLPSDCRELPEGVPAQEQLTNGALQGKNDFKRIGYGGPCPPPGRSHRYRLSLYALDRSLDLKAGMSKKQVVDNLSGHILAQGQLTGTFQR